MQSSLHSYEVDKWAAALQPLLTCAAWPGSGAAQERRTEADALALLRQAAADELDAVCIAPATSPAAALSDGCEQHAGPKSCSAFRSPQNAVVLSQQLQKGGTDT